MIFFLQGYQFWTKANDKGFFSISGIRPGIYNVYAWVPGFIGDYRHDTEVTITPGLVLFLFDNMFLFLFFVFGMQNI